MGTSHGIALFRARRGATKANNVKTSGLKAWGLQRYGHEGRGRWDATPERGQRDGRLYIRFARGGDTT